MKTTKKMAPKLNPQVAPRERRIDHSTVSRPKRSKGRTVAHGAAETLEQFMARGGQVQRLTAIWEKGYAA
ncbi:hypothetical protein CR919_14985 [Stenotrophomonas sp. LMG 10879]|uniref:hypothetical protein n=1 Tax=Stenotrophomonas sp. LMG 10879 TaxID=487706 RepID=UPI000C194025|nr:hypothetical protein [Stenotrophomonas sp. LMG 10879]PII18991.1 hypothetical protein CR919_14985 [Stenotrophomonas sp. LMG 10879]